MSVGQTLRLVLVFDIRWIFQDSVRKQLICRKEEGHGILRRSHRPPE